MLPIFVYDNTLTNGGGLGSLTSATSGLVGEYRRKGQSSWTAITLTSATLGTFTSGGWVADGALTGAYEVGIPDAAMAAGVDWVLIRYRGAASMAAVVIEVELDAINYQDSVRAGLTAIPNAAANASGGLPVLNSGLAVKADLDTIRTQAVTAAAGVTFPASVASPTNITAATGVNLAATGLDAITATTPAGIPTTFPGKLLMVYQRFFGKTAKAASGSTLKVYADDNATVIATQTWSDDGAGTESLTKAS